MIKIYNEGEMDFIQSISLLGASVKQTEDAIGLFGSGVKYALALAAREGVDVTLVSGSRILDLETRPEVFRGKTFKRLVLKDRVSNEVYPTSLTEDFGKEDWNDLWFLFREFYSNALDEKDHSICETGVVTEEPGGTAVYLGSPMQRYHHNLTDWFKEMDPPIQKGTGRCYKRGVFVGQASDIPFDWRDDDLALTETRIAHDYELEKSFAEVLCEETSQEIWEAALKDEYIREDVRVGISRGSEATDAFLKAVVKGYGDRTVLVTLDEARKLDTIATIISRGYKTLVLRWYLPTAFDSEVEGVFRLSDLQIGDYADAECLSEADVASELAIVRSLGFTRTVEMFSATILADGTRGLYEKTPSFGHRVILDKDLFQETPVNGVRRELLHVLLHEMGHAQSGAGDYERRFTDIFVDALVNLAI